MKNAFHTAPMPLLKKPTFMQIDLLHVNRQIPRLKYIRFVNEFSCFFQHLFESSAL